MSYDTVFSIEIWGKAVRVQGGGAPDFCILPSTASDPVLFLLAQS